jgi:hypothetical protein
LADILCPQGLISCCGHILYGHRPYGRFFGEIMPHTILYARVSSSAQTIQHQRTQAEQAGFKIDDVVADDGVSGVRTRLCERPVGKRLYDKLRAGDVLVVRWGSAGAKVRM